MPYYNTCPDCGSTLDPGERCDCQKPVPYLEEIDKHIYKLRDWPKNQAAPGATEQSIKNDAATDDTVTTLEG